MKKSVESIQDEYTKAVESGSRSVVANTGKGRFADYAESDLAGVPVTAHEQSFGCGNPLAFSEVQAGDTVLDLGCGAGLDVLIASECVGESGYVIGVDANRSLLAIAQRNCAGRPNIELREGYIEALPVSTASVDWVISNCVINLSDQKHKAFSEIARVLNSNGRMLVSDIVAEDLPFWVRHSGVLKAACGGGVISENEYLVGLRDAGLVDSKVLARQFYDRSQLAAIVSESAPRWLRNVRCCGVAVLHKALSVLAGPVAERLWSVKISARMPV